MTTEEAIKILDPETSRDALWKYEEDSARLEACKEACKLGAATLRTRQDPPPNGPLTLEELRHMNGEPVFIKLDGGYWGIVDCDDGVIAMPGHGVLPLACSGRFVYRRRPEEAQHER